MNDFTLLVRNLPKAVLMVKLCNYYCNQINDKIDLWLLISTDLHLILEETFAQMICTQDNQSFPFVFPAHLPHPPAIVSLVEKRG